MKLKPLVQMMFMVPVAFLPATTALYASDLTIYRGNEVGKTSILLMLDTSGSMGISSLVLPKNNIYGSPGDVDTALCERTSVIENNQYGNPSNTAFWQWKYNLLDTRVGSPTYNKTSIYKKVTIGGEDIVYYMRGCQKTIGGKVVQEYDRLSRLKDAIIPLLADTSETGLSNEVIMGLGHFSSKTELNVSNASNKLVDGHSGRILVPNAPLSVEQRRNLARAIAEFKSLDVISNEDGTANADLKSSSRNYPNVLKAASGTPTAHAYAEAGAYMMGTNTGKDTAHDALTGIHYVYDGYMVMQNGSEQAHFLCVELGPTLTNALGGSQNVKQCVNNWPAHSGQSVSSGTINAGVYKPDGKGGWQSVTADQLKTASGGMANGWDTFKKFPVGWRYGGWMKVDNEPMDIEAIVATVWTGYAGGTVGLVSYRTNPFALQENAQPTTSYTDNLVGGMKYSVPASISGNNYIKGGSSKSCDGNGIYFLTDGAPNSTKDNMAKAIMNHSLVSPDYQFDIKPSGTGSLTSPVLKSGLFSGETGGWEYIGAYAKKLADTSKNPGALKVKTAVVGFGASFAGITRNADGTYNCETVKNTNLDAYNACRWGSKDFGEGGFYYAENAEDIKSSIVKFVEDVKVTFTPSSIGSISIPRDPLDQTQVMSKGFFPMILPEEDTTRRTWAGNLKKYNIVDGTLKDNGNRAVYLYEDGEQKVNPKSKDLWSNASTTIEDHSFINSGGAWNKIPVPSLLNTSGEPSKVDATRNVFIIDTEESKSVLKKVHKNKLATNFSGSDEDPALSNNISINQRYALLGYLGHKVDPFPPAPNATLTGSFINSLETPDSPYRFLGGVVHSTPLVVTQTAQLSSNVNSVDKRDELVIYGSMEGGLHIVDADTGVEKSVFVPKEILSNQYDTLAIPNSIGLTGMNGIAYGVDAPWTADTKYSIKNIVGSTSTTTAYTADVLNIYGGLRMGGEALYGLDILSPTKPKLLFHITPSTSGFSRMAQIWSKPTVTQIRVKGERKKVLIFGGGYDASVFENENVGSDVPNDKTRGNAVYIVDAEKGTLLATVSADAKKTGDDSDKVLYSVVGQPAVRDYDADGLTDMIYFADLGGQIFRVDLNNVAQYRSNATSDLIVRTKRIADLTETGFKPRFYDRLTTAIFKDDEKRTFVLINATSGNRSYPLEPSSVRNKVYGIMDYDAATNGLESTKYNTPIAQGGLGYTFSAEATIDNMSNKGLLAGTNTKASDLNLTTLSHNAYGRRNTQSSEEYRGWYFALKSAHDNSADSEYYSKSFEESQLIASDLYVNLFDPKATLTETKTCDGGVRGTSTTHRICAPFATCAAYVTQPYQGIAGPALGAVSGKNKTSSLVGPLETKKEICFGDDCGKGGTGAETDLSKYKQERKIKPVRWFEW